MPNDESKEPLDMEKWTPGIKKKSQVDVRAVNIVQYGLTKEELNWIKLFDITKNL